jgi:hypothetical protein
MPGRGTMDDQNYGYDDDLAGANNAEFGEDSQKVILPTLADSIAASAADADDAVEMCRDLANAENLDEDQYLELVNLVERTTGFELPEEGQRF